MARYKIYILTLLSCSLINWGSFASARERVEANIQPLFDACIDRCDRTDILGNLTREGCEKGCEQIRRTFPLTGKKYSSDASCLEDTKDIELNRDLLIEKYQDWCVKTYDHIHKRKGCKDAVEVYINAISYENLCTRGNPVKKKITSPTISAPIPIHESTTKTATPIKSKQTVIKNTTLAKTTAKSSSPVVQSSIAKTSQAKIDRTNSVSTPSLQTSNRGISSSPSIKPLFADKSVAQYPLLSRNTSNMHQSISQQGNTNKTLLPAMTTISSPQKNIIASSSLTSKNNNIKSSKNTKLTAPTVSMRNALSSSNNEKKKNSPNKGAQKITTQKEVTAQVVQANEKKFSSQKELNDKTKEITAHSIVKVTTNATNEIAVPMALQEPATQKAEESLSASTQTTSVVDTSSNIVAPTEKVMPQTQTPNTPAIIPTEKNKNVMQEITASQASPLEAKSSLTTTVIEVEPNTKPNPELEKLIDDVQAEMGNSKKSIQSSSKKNVSVIPSLPPATLSSPIPSLGVIPETTLGDNLLQQKSNSTAKKQEEKNISTQSKQVQVDPAIQLTQGLRQAPQTPTQPYGLSLPPSAVKAPPPPIP